MEFFRHCPGCGKKFHIKLVDKTLVDEYETSSEGPLVGGGIVRGGVAIVREGPISFDVKEFRYAYKCEHCGHEWSETRLDKKGDRTGPSKTIPILRRSS